MSESWMEDINPARRNGGLFVCFLPAGNTPSREEADIQVWSIAWPNVLGLRG
jgi:hypothetical protein